MDRNQDAVTLANLHAWASQSRVPFSNKLILWKHSSDNFVELSLSRPYARSVIARLCTFCRMRKRTIRRATGSLQTSDPSIAGHQPHQCMYRSSYYSVE